MPAEDKFGELYTMITAGTITFLVFAGLIVFVILFYQKRRFQHKEELLQMQQEYNEALLQSQLETHEATLNQISEEIHDNIGQLLSSTKMLLGITERSLHNIPDTLRTAEETLGKAIQDLRALSKSLNKEWLRQFNLTDNLKTEVERLCTSHTIHAEYFTSTGFMPMQAEAQVMLFRIVQEALQNTIKHANAQNVTIRTLFSNDHITVKVEDDGIGFNKENTIISGIGMMNMQHRTKLLGGTIAWNALPQGTQVFITLPVQQQNV